MPAKAKPAKPARISSAIPMPERVASILSLDTSSTSVGWARWWREEGSVERPAREQRDSGALPLAEMATHRWHRVDLFARWFTREIETRRPDMVLLEEVFSSQKDAAATQHILQTLYGLVHLICWRRQIHVRDLSRGPVVKALLGWAMKKAGGPSVRCRGGWRPKMRGATKTEVKTAIEARHGFKVATDDEADAIAGLDMVLAEMAGIGIPIAIGWAPPEHGEMVPATIAPAIPKMVKAARVRGIIPRARGRAPARG